MVVYLALPWLGRLPIAGYVGIGVGWLVLTVVFEFTLGLVIEGRPLPQVLEAYTFKDGNIWPVVLLVTAGAPCLAAWLRGWL